MIVFEVLKSPLEDILVRSRAAEITNVLVAQCPDNCALFNKHYSPKSVLEIMESAPDFLLQTVLFEIFFRLTVSLSTVELNQLLDGRKDLVKLMTGDLNDDFERLTRKFVMVFNANLKEHQRGKNHFYQLVLPFSHVHSVFFHYKELKEDRLWSFRVAGMDRRRL